MLGLGTKQGHRMAGLFSSQASMGDVFVSITFQNNLSEIPTTLKSYNGLHGAHIPSSLSPLGLEHF